MDFLCLLVVEMAEFFYHLENDILVNEYHQEPKEVDIPYIKILLCALPIAIGFSVILSSFAWWAIKGMFRISPAALTKHENT